MEAPAIRFVFNKKYLSQFTNHYYCDLTDICIVNRLSKRAEVIAEQNLSWVLEGCELDWMHPHGEGRVKQQKNLFPHVFVAFACSCLHLSCHSPEKKRLSNFKKSLFPSHCLVGRHDSPCPLNGRMSLLCCLQDDPLRCRTKCCRLVTKGIEKKGSQLRKRSFKSMWKKI
ncbi:hypothetical protein CDAR_506571 [Caerostris darwini]|uniref:Uncharacterized protein n=1 Tax=Caerostris darwini TaxID=1538125 RepID=A0AAV4QBV2_9ARAC|nr:hypothetical protein CDAR_506361 [Caerostris darwini]GIY05784.1 hypothetical protein CDAR_506571 [Caerostris darwini]